MSRKFFNKECVEWTIAVYLWFSLVGKLLTLLGKSIYGIIQYISLKWMTYINNVYIHVVHCQLMIL